MRPDDAPGDGITQRPRLAAEPDEDLPPIRRQGKRGNQVGLGCLSVMVGLLLWFFGVVVPRPCFPEVEETLYHLGTYGIAAAVGLGLSLRAIRSPRSGLLGVGFGIVAVFINGLLVAFVTRALTSWLY